MPTKSLQATIFGVDQASPVFKKVAGSASDMADSTAKSGEKMGNAFKKGAQMAAGALAAVGFADFVKGTVREASNLQQNMGAVESVFKDTTGAITDFGATSADTVGLAKQDYYELASVFGSQLKNMGVAADQLAPKTNELVQLGADLSSMYGGTASEAVQAISSLLRGERDPIERYGVSIKQASISAYELAHGLDTSTAEAKTASDTQATLALLFQQTADAQGNFARESDTLAGAQQRASAKFKEAQAEIGTKLLPILTDLTTFAAEDLVPILGTVADVIGGVVDVVDGIPGPVKLALAALVGFKLFQQTGTFAKLAAGARGFREQMVLQQGLARMEGAELTNMGAAATVAKGKMASLGRVIGRGGLFAGALFLITEIVDAFSNLNQEAEDAQRAVSGVADALADSGGKWTDEVQEMAEASIKQADFFDTLTRAGAEYGDVMTAILHPMQMTAEQQERFSEAAGELSMSQGQSLVAFMKQYGGAVQETGAQIADYRAEQQRAADVQQHWADMAAHAAEEWKRLNPVIDKSAVALGEQARAAAYAGRAQAEWQAQVKKQRDIERSAKNVRDLAASMEEARKEGHDLSGALSEVQEALAELSGRTPEVEEATRAFNGALADAKGKASGFKSSMIEANGVIDTSTAVGRDLYDTVTQIADAAQDAALAQAELAGKTGGTDAAAKAASDTLDKLRQDFIDNAKQIGITKDAAEKLANAYFGLPKQIETVVKGRANFTDVDAKIQALADRTVWVNVAGKMQQGISGQLGVVGGPMLAKAGGGYISGPGTGTSDSILARVSNGEFVVNARATAGNRGLLEAINSGQAGGLSGGSGDVQVRVFIGDQELKGMVRTEIASDHRGARQLARQGAL